MITANSKYLYNYFANNFYNYMIRNKSKEIGLNEIIEGGRLADFSFKDFYGIDILIENPNSFPNLERFIFDLLNSFADHFCYNIEISDGNMLIRSQNNDTILNFNFKEVEI